MFIPYLRHACLIFVLFLTSPSFADIYKWVDSNGQIHYSQLMPVDQNYELIRAPAPPAINPADAQKSVDSLMKQQADADKEKQERLEKAKENAVVEATRKENCRIAQHNLQQHQNNPNRRVMDAEGNVTRPAEEERQNKIAEFQQHIKDYCF